MNGVTAGLSSFYFLQIMERYIWEYINGFGFQPGFRLESQEEILARVEAEAQAEMMKRARAEAESQARMAQAQSVMIARAEAGQAQMEAEASQQQMPESMETMMTKKMNEGVVPNTIPVPGFTMGLSVPDVNIPLVEKPVEANFEQVKMIVNNRYNPDGESSLYQIPSILAILVCLIGTVLSALNIVMEKENGTIEQMNVSPVKRSAFIFSKIIPFGSSGWLS